MNLRLLATPIFIAMAAWPIAVPLAHADGVEQAPVIETIAGNGTFTPSGDGGPALEAGLGMSGIALDAAGNILIADEQNHVVRRIDVVSGIIDRFAGTGTVGSAGDGGPAREATLDAPVAFAVSAAGEVYIADRDAMVVRMVGTDGKITTVAGGGAVDAQEGVATEVQLSSPAALAFDGAGNLLIGDLQRVRRVDSAGMLTTLAGIQEQGYSGDGGPATEAQFRQITALAVDPAGHIYLLDFQDHVLRRIDADTGIVTTVAGAGVPGYSGDGGPAAQAMLNYPSGLAFTADGELIISDSGNNRIRAIDAAGTIRTIAGNGAYGFSGDGGPATEARLALPQGVAVRADGAFLIADRNNGRIRRVDEPVQPRTWCDPEYVFADSFHDETASGSWQGTYVWNCGSGLEGSHGVELELHQVPGTFILSGTIHYNGSSTEVFGTRYCDVSVSQHGFVASGVADPRGRVIHLAWDPSASFVGNHLLGTIAGDDIAGDTINGDSAVGEYSGCSANVGPSGSMQLHRTSSP